MPVRIDASELRAFGRDMVGVPARTRAKVAAAVKKGAVNVKDAIQEDVRESWHPAFRQISIGFELQSVGNGIAADISPRDGGASDLANIAFFGTARSGYATRHEFYEHAESELPTLAEYVAKAGEEALS